MIRLEQITALFLAAGLAIPSYWFFWSLAGGGGYDRRSNQNIETINNETQKGNPIKGLL
tara:strand:+ start:835 stop:1011 length:177 start_codon:yes stop_codon:yes gene_type:complete